MDSKRLERSFEFKSNALLNVTSLASWLFLFAGESDFELKLEVEKNRDKMLKRLKTLKNMPPRASDEYQEIQMNPKLRNEIIEDLESI